MNKSVEVTLEVKVKGRLTEKGDIRDLEPVVQVIIEAAASAYKTWAEKNLKPEDHAGFDYAVKLSRSKA